MMDFKKERDSLVLGNDGLEAWLRSFAARVLREEANLMRNDTAASLMANFHSPTQWLERRATEIEKGK